MRPVRNFDSSPLGAKNSLPLAAHVAATTWTDTLQEVTYSLDTLKMERRCIEGEPKLPVGIENLWRSGRASAWIGFRDEEFPMLDMPWRQGGV